MSRTRVRVRRETPSALAWSIALAVTMLAVYALTWQAAGTRVTAQVSASPRVTRKLELSGMEGWCVTLGAWPDAGRARVEAAAGTGRGSAGRVFEAEGVWQVLGAMYPTRQQASSVAATLREGGQEAAGVLALTVPPVTLRITAPEAQIALIDASDRMLLEQAQQLGNMATRLDRGELQPEAVQTLCALASTEARQLAEQLSRSGGAGAGDLCGMQSAALSALSARLDDAAASAPLGATALSGQLRLAGIDTCIHLSQMRDTLLGI